MIKNDQVDGNMCLICYDNESYTIKCADKFCKTRICLECFEVYLRNCITEKQLCKCLNEYCKSFYLSDQFTGAPFGVSSPRGARNGPSIPCGAPCGSGSPTGALDPLRVTERVSELYKQVLVTAFTHSQGPDIIEKINAQKLISDIRKQRKQFIKTFPKAIDLVVNVALSKKLKDVSKQNTEYIKDLVKKSNKICMNSFCNGRLDSKFECFNCRTRFCKECEKAITGLDPLRGHVCKKEDLESIRFIKDSVMKCPGCKIPIQKSEGCNGMTCANCKTTFDYRTGSLSNHGSFNQPLPSVQKKIFDFEFKDYYQYDVARKLRLVELGAPKEPSIVMLNNAVAKLLNDSDSVSVTTEGVTMSTPSTVPEDVMVSFEKYIKSKIIYNNFIRATVEINELHELGVLTLSDLEDIINKWQR
jgi:hypothetical protein